MQTMTDLSKWIRVGIGLFIIAVSTRMWFLKPELVPFWGVFAAWVVGAAIGFSTVMRGLFREALPFLNRRGVGPINEASTDTLPPASAQQDATGLINLPPVERRKSRKKK